MRSVRPWKLSLGLLALACAGVITFNEMSTQNQGMIRTTAQKPQDGADQESWEEPRTTAPQQAIYIWQRQWTPAVEQALSQASDVVNAVMVLACEFETEKRSPVAAGWKALAATKKPVWVVIRARQLPGIGERSRRAAMARGMAALARGALAAGRGSGTQMAGVQIDYDSPTAGLKNYAAFLTDLRRKLPDTPLSITALPDWLSQPAFRDVLRGLDHFVLQVHSLDKPSNVDNPVTLCDPARARQWIRAAGKLNCPFYVALPTYGYRLFFDAPGDFVALGAEGGPQSLASGSSQELHADPKAMAALVREIGPDLPSNALGWAWFRLPVEGDRLNWTWPVLRGVMAGQAPQAVLHAEMRTPSEGLYEVWVRNGGDYCPAKPIRVTVRYSDAKIGAYDTLNGFRAQESGEAGTMSLEGSAPKPGAEAMVAWYRMTPADSEKPVFEVSNVEVTQ